MGSRTFTVLSDNLDGHKAGDVVKEDKLSHLNLDALVAAGHLSEKKDGSKDSKGED